MSVFHGDITTLKEVDCIVNSTNPRLYGLGGVCGAICNAAGPDLKKEIKLKYPKGCARYEAKITQPHNLSHLKAIIHTVGPVCRTQQPQENHKKALANCYIHCLNVAGQKQFSSIAFPCISTGVYGYPQKDAAMLVVKTCLDSGIGRVSYFDSI